MSHLDRTGEPIDPDQPSSHYCVDGWLPGHTRDDDQPRPCPVCRPHLTPEKRRQRLWGSSDPGPALAAADPMDTRATGEVATS